MDDYMKEICGNCGCIFGKHGYPYKVCPNYKGIQSTLTIPGTIFKPTNQYEEKDITHEDKGGKK